MKRIEVPFHVYKKIEEDRAHFQKTIGGKNWSKADVLAEWIKILRTLE